MTFRKNEERHILWSILSQRQWLQMFSQYLYLLAITLNQKKKSLNHDWPFMIPTPVFISIVFHSLGKRPVFLWGVISSPLQWSHGRKGHPRVSSFPRCHSLSSFESFSPSISPSPLSLLQAAFLCYYLTVVVNNPRYGFQMSPPPPRPTLELGIGLVHGAGVRVGHLL